MAVDMHELADDLAAETSALADLVADLDEAGWRLPTPAPGWTIGDQFSHLAFFDDAAVRAATDPDAFAAELERAAAAGHLDPDDIADRYRSLTGAALLAWFEASRQRLIDVFAGLDPAVRLPWFGPPMSAASSVTARIMETWAHGQDVADALGRVRESTVRLRHIAHIGVRALPFSFVVNGLEVPAEPVRVELAGPGGELWTWGPQAQEASERAPSSGVPQDRRRAPSSGVPPRAVNLVTGPALDFCLLVTQRRHRGDTAIVADGPVADQWLAIAQAFAGPPGPGRRLGQHR